MASYRVEITASAERALTRLPKADLVRVVRAIRTLAAVPRPAGCRKLKGHEDVYRIRVGVYRVIYSIDHRRIIVVVLKVGHRKQVYG
ncbi:MAG: type II toxin-antitoxin system RelE/ParE family toxin [Acidobacteriota bacterium]